MTSFYGLSCRELAVLRRIANGMTDEQIAADLLIPVDTVKGDLVNLLGKMGTTSRTEGALRAIKEGMPACIGG